MNKAVAIKTIKGLPASFSIDELFEKLVFIEKVNEGIEDADKGRVFSSKDARKKLKKWLK